LLKKIYKMQHLEGSGTPVLYIGRTVLKGQRTANFHTFSWKTTVQCTAVTGCVSFWGWCCSIGTRWRINELYGCVVRAFVCSFVCL